jgi:DNA-binding transcriptional regulator YiaG
MLELAEARRYAATGEGRRIRLAARMSENNTARACGTSQANVSRWENGIRLPIGEAGIRWGQFLRLLEARGFTVDDEPAAR